MGLAIAGGLIVAVASGLTAWIYQIGARVAVLEARTLNVEEWLKRIDCKLDKVLEACASNCPLKH
jgi:hypothetical protein